jgi:sulfate-transporting ATPase
MAAYQYIYTMKDLRKVVPNGKEVLKRHLPLVLPRREDRRARRNGAGKSTMLQDHGGRR